MALTKKANDRRTKFRFDMQREIRYKLVEEGALLASGTGSTLNMCSGGIAFSTEQALQPRAFAELSISWPVLLDETCPMRLIVFGRIRRSGGGKAVLWHRVIASSARKPVQRKPATAVRSDSMLQRFACEMRKESLKMSQPAPEGAATYRRRRQAQACSRIWFRF